MPTYEVTAYAEGKATVKVYAAGPDEAEAVAYRDHLTGILINGGEATWTVETVEEIEP